VTDGDPRKKLAYDESIRALQQQSSVLDDLRTRTGIVLAALSITAGFLGAKALENPGLTTWSWAAIVCFALAGVFSLCVLWPSGKWSFTSNAKIILEDLSRDDSITLDEMYGTYGEANQEAWESHDRDRLKPLIWFFRLAVIFLVLQVGFWLAALGTSHAAAEKTQQTPVGTVQRGGTAIP
jgi:drug/metabolite transporter (DMT)-like permease